MAIEEDEEDGAGSVSNKYSDVHLKGGSLVQAPRTRHIYQGLCSWLTEEKSKAKCASGLARLPCLMSGHLRF